MKTSIVFSSFAAGIAALGLATASFAQSFTDFDSFSTGSVDGQGGWMATGPYDQEVVDLGGGNKAWRVSNAVTSGSFGDMPFGPASGFYSGESVATHKPDSQPANTSSYYASFDFSSFTGGAQPGLRVTVSPDDGVGRRMSFIAIDDTGSGYDLTFFDTQDNNLLTNHNGGFVSTVVATGLSYNQIHTLAFDIDFVDGLAAGTGVGDLTGNDVVNILVDGSVVHTGTTWESYHYTTDEGSLIPGVSQLGVHAIDTLLFRISGTAAPGTAGAGFLIDNVSITAVPEPATLVLAGLALLGLVGIARRRK